MVDMAANIPACASAELQSILQHAFVSVMQEAARKEPKCAQLVIAAVYLLCWLRKYKEELFRGYKSGEMGCFVLLGGCKKENEALFLRLLSLLPVDVLILAPDLAHPCCLQSDLLLEISGTESLAVTHFPRDAASLQLRTVAAAAERELDATLYNQTGIYRSRQFAQAEVVTLQTTYDELFMLWDQPLKYRDGFSTTENMVRMPVVYAKVNGVERSVNAYWQKVRQLLGENVLLVRSVPMIAEGTMNDFQALAVKAIRNGKIHRELVKADRNYPFGLIREELQEHIFDKLQLMLDRRVIRGTFERGMEYTVLATVLNMDKDMVRRLQSFDFTQRNPKLVVISTRDRTASLEDTILFTFLHLVGFDMVFFVPTGYQVLERYLQDMQPVNHQLGDYKYDLEVPELQAKGFARFMDKFKRGG